MAQPHRVIVLGGGFGGLEPHAKTQATPVVVIRIDRRNFHKRKVNAILNNKITSIQSITRVATRVRGCSRIHRRDLHSRRSIWPAHETRIQVGLA
jgi:hypothetical protein